MLEIFQSGGWLMWLILLCSIVVVAISIERYIALKTEKVVPSGQLSQVWQTLRNGEYDRQSLKALRDSSPLGYILAASISNAGHGREVMKDSVEEAAAQVIHQMERFIDILGTVASVSPLLGLLGTVLGMIEVFSDIMLYGTGNAGQLAGGISQALVTTAFGLTVGIPAMISHRYFERKVETLIVMLEGQANKLVDAMHSDLFVQQAQPVQDTSNYSSGDSEDEAAQ